MTTNPQICPHCQTPLLPDAKFCMKCGQKLEKLCPHCQTPLLPEAKFCMKCGATITNISSEPANAAAIAQNCPQCGQEIIPGAKFCLKCGASLKEQIPTPPAATPPNEPLSEKRKRTAKSGKYSKSTASTKAAETAHHADENTTVKTAPTLNTSRAENHGAASPAAPPTAQENIASQATESRQAADSAESPKLEQKPNPADSSPSAAPPLNTAKSNQTNLQTSADESAVTTAPGTGATPTASIKSSAQSAPPASETPIEPAMQTGAAESSASSNIQEFFLLILILILIALAVAAIKLENNPVNTTSISNKSNTLTETKPAIPPKAAKTAHQPKDSYTRLPYMKDRPVKLGYSLVTVKAINAPYTRDFLEIKELPHSLTEVNINSASGDYSYHYYLTSDRVIEIAYSWGYGPITGKNDPALKKQFAKARQEIVGAGYGRPTAENGLKCQWKAADGHTVTLKCEVPNNSKWVLFETKITADK